MASVVWTAAEIAALRAAIALGATSVKHGDKTVVYNSLDDMIALLDRMCRSIESPARPVAHFATHRRN